MFSAMKYEFQVKHLKYQDCEATQFYKSQWTDNRLVFVIFKLVLLLYWTAFLIAGLASYEELYSWWTKLTSWGVVTILLYLISSTALAIYGLSRHQMDTGKHSQQSLNTIASTVQQTVKLENNNNMISSDPKPDLKWCHKVVWILFEVSCGVALTITATYWSLLEVRLTPFSINNHLINSVIILLDLMFGKIPVRVLHFYNLFLFSIIYVTFSLILHGTGFSSAVYPVLDWENHWRAALGLSICVVVLVSPFVHFVVYCLYSLKKFIASKLEPKNKQPMIPGSTNSHSNKNQATGEDNPSFQA